MEILSREEQVANSIIEMLQEAGLTPAQMIPIIRAAERKYWMLKLNSPEMMN